jgi:hypothetical protein
MTEPSNKLRQVWENKRHTVNPGKKGSVILKYPFEKKFFGFNTENSHDYETRNSLGFRCDEFKNNHEGKHIVFSGCSVTFGVGLELDEVWSHKVYKKINEVENVSGYYNLGVPGTGLFFMVSNLFKYFDKYGNPDTVFLNLTDLLRFYSVEEFPPEFKKPYVFEKMINVLENRIYHDQEFGIDHKDSHFARWVNYYDYILMLELYCKTNKIELIIFSYSGSTNEAFSRVELDSFHNIDPNYIIDKLIEYVAENKVDDYFLTARDAQHEGHGLHSKWAEKVFEIYIKDKNVN